MAKAYHVLKFVMLDFDEKWDRALIPPVSSTVQYTSNQPDAELAVVVESVTGSKTTYRYKIGPMQDVFVIDQVVHIPDRCIKQEAENTVKCRQG
jgi:hypothetical protein